MIKQQDDIVLQKNEKIKQANINIKKINMEISKLQQEASIYKKEEAIKVKMSEEEKIVLRQSIKDIQMQIDMEMTNGKKELEERNMKMNILKKKLKELTISNKSNSHKILEAIRLSKSSRFISGVKLKPSNEIEQKAPTRAERAMRYKRMKLKKPTATSGLIGNTESLNS